MKKRIFIAVGSEAIKGVRELIKRLCEENLFKRFDDLFIAIDSDTSKVAAFNELGMRLQTPRVKGFDLVIDENDEVAKKVFQHGWTTRQIHADGVGGDRTISGKVMALFRNVWSDSGMRLGSELGKEDEIFVVGSAFGGTAGGLFLNICEFLDLQIRTKRNADQEFKTVKVSGFLMMPEAVASEGSYPIANNMIDMFRDLQTISWRRRLESERVGFKVPVLGHFNGKEFELFNRVEPDSHKLMEYGVQGSSLPMSNLYVVPTPQGKRPCHTSILAESLFVAAYIDVDHRFVQLVNRQKEGSLGPAENIGVEDNCLCGFNMFVMKSGRLVSLKNWFWHSLMEAVKGTNGCSGLLCGDENHPVIPTNIKEVFQQVQTPQRNEPLAGVSEEDCGPLKTLLEKERDALVSLRAMNDFSDQIQGCLDSLFAMAPSYRAVPAKELIVVLSSSAYSDWNREMNFGMVQKGYVALRNEMMTQQNNRKTYAAEMVSALNKAIALIKARQKHRVVRDWAFGLSQEDAVFHEITEAFDAKFKSLLKSYIYACRCEKTPMLDVDGFARELENYKNECRRWYGVLKQKCVDLHGGGNPYIIEGKLIETLKPLPSTQQTQLAFNPLRTLMCVAYRSCVSNLVDVKQSAVSLAALGDKGGLLATMTSTADELLENAEESVINRYIEIAEDLPPGVNPLTDATLANFADVKLSTIGCHSFADVLKVSDSGEGHYHFMVKQGEMPTHFHMTNDDVHNAPLGLSTMPGTDNLASEFLSCDHSGTSDPSLWKSETTAFSPMFAGLRDPDKPTRVSGLWLGTLGIDFKVRNALDRIYSFAPNVRLGMVRAGLMAPKPRRLMTLAEMVRFGVTMEAIEAALKEQWAQHKQRPGSEHDTVLLFGGDVQVSIEKPGCRFTLPAARLVDCGVIDNVDGSCSFETLTVEWSARIFDWLRDKTANGFDSFFPSAQFTSLLQAETDIFQFIRFSITAAEIAEMNAAKAIVKKAVKISGL